MSEPVVTEADWEKAEALIADIHSGWCAGHPEWQKDHPGYPCHCRLAGKRDALAAALAAERAKARAPFLRLIDEEAAEAQARGQFYTITVEIPMAVGTETIDRIFGAVADAAHDCQPEQRDWDVFVHGCGPAHQSVPLHFIRRAARDRQAFSPTAKSADEETE